MYRCAITPPRNTRIGQTTDFSINGLCTENCLLSFYHNGPQHQKVQVNDRFGDKNRFKSSNFNAMTLKFSEKLCHPFSHVLLFGNLFPESHGFVATPVTSCIKDTSPIYPYLICKRRLNCSTIIIILE